MELSLLGFGPRVFFQNINNSVRVVLTESTQPAAMHSQSLEKRVMGRSPSAATYVHTTDSPPGTFCYPLEKVESWRLP